MAHLGDNCYGKSRVRLSRITRHGDRHDFQEWTVRVLLYGDFEPSFTQADNSCILPTDTMKNTVYSTARSSNAVTIEEFAMELGDYLLTNNPQVLTTRIEIEERAWQRMQCDATDELTTFKLGGPERHTVVAERNKSVPWIITSGIEELTILKTTNSAFTGYIKDRLTTLRPATDRILGTSATATWTYASPAQDFVSTRARILASLLRTFADHHSMSVQHTLFDMGKAALDAAPEITSIKLIMPNLHHLPADLSPFGQDNPNHIFVPIDEPHGYIEATIER
jgi:urate oxidase